MILYLFIFFLFGLIPIGGWVKFTFFKCFIYVVDFGCKKKKKLHLFEWKWSKEHTSHFQLSHPSMNKKKYNKNSARNTTWASTFATSFYGTSNRITTIRFPVAKSHLAGSMLQKEIARCPGDPMNIDTFSSICVSRVHISLALQRNDWFGFLSRYKWWMN